jgi:hypothetical protein
MSIFGLFTPTAEQEETSNSYQAWREENPDNPSDDDFYDDDADLTDDNDDSDRAGENFTGWFGLW